MRGLKRISTTEQIQQFVDLWTLVNQTCLTQHPDEITWHFTTCEQYSARSAYAVQFLGSFADHTWDNLWAVKVENKCKFFCWLILQNKLWMKDRISKHGGQTNQICSLCHTHNETTLHMVALCCYSKLVWGRVSSWIGTTLQLSLILSYRMLKTWWTSMLQI
jgi:hypothetical protein